MNKRARIFWFTGLSGSGKSTLAHEALATLDKKGYSSLIIDGDMVRSRYKEKLGFSRDDIKTNNLNILKYCQEVRSYYDVILVPVIAPIENVRALIKQQLSPGFYLIYLSSDLDSLRKRDTKGLYKKAELKQITDLIGCSVLNPYDIPRNSDLIIDTSETSDKRGSINKVIEFIIHKFFLTG